MASHDGAGVLRRVHATRPDPCTMILFGAGGDLTKRKLMPAIYNLAASKLLPEEFAIVGVSIEPYSNDEFRNQMTQDIREYSIDGVDMSCWDWFVKRLYYTSGDFKDPGLYQKLKQTLELAEKEQRTEGNRLFYLATSPVFFPTVVQQLGAAGLTRTEGHSWRRVVIEKPFGHDLASAVALNSAVGDVREEKQVYRIDHYLGKETV